MRTRWTCRLGAPKSTLDMPTIRRKSYVKLPTGTVAKARRPSLGNKVQLCRQRPLYSSTWVRRSNATRNSAASAPVKGLETRRSSGRVVYMPFDRHHHPHLCDTAEAVEVASRSRARWPVPARPRRSAPLPVVCVLGGRSRRARVSTEKTLPQTYRKDSRTHTPLSALSRPRAVGSPHESHRDAIAALPG